MPPSFLASYLAPIADLLDEPDVVEIALNPNGSVWIERQGAAHMDETSDLSLRVEQSTNLAQAIASEVGAQFSDKKPVVSGKILWREDPIRAQIIAPPIVEGGCAISLRRYVQPGSGLGDMALLHGALVDLDQRRQERRAEVHHLASIGSVVEAMRLCVEDRLNVLISGGTSTGKTTFARSLLGLIDRRERILTIEDAFELFPSQLNSLCLKSERVAGTERSPSKLLEASLRMRPDRILLGELRGEESRTYLDAINTGHGGSITTIHADSARKAIDRLALMVMASGIPMGFEQIHRYCAASIDVVVQLGRVEGRRGVVEVWTCE